MLKQICKTKEIHLFEDHLLRLDPESRYTRFQGITSDNTIRAYVAKIISEPNHEILGKFHENNIIGSAHIGLIGNLAELAFSVELPYRGYGYGKLLFKKCLEIAKDYNCSYIHTDCFSSNTAMMKLASSIGLEIYREGPDATAAGLIEVLVN